MAPGFMRCAGVGLRTRSQNAAAQTGPPGRRRTKYPVRPSFGRTTGRPYAGGWNAAYLPYKIRCDELQLSKGGRIIKRYYLPDLDALLVTRPPQRIVNLTPAFHM